MSEMDNYTPGYDAFVDYNYDDILATKHDVKSRNLDARIKK